MRLKFLPLAVLLVWLVVGCGSKSVVFVGEAEPADFSLSFQVPEVFSFPVAEDGNYDWEVELTYFPEQMQAWTDIPVYYIHVDPAGKESEGKFKIPVKDVKGEWIGDLQENGHDRLTRTTFVTGLALGKGDHQVKIYGDNTQEGEPILGIVRLTFKVKK